MPPPAVTLGRERIEELAAAEWDRERPEIPYNVHDERKHLANMVLVLFERLQVQTRRLPQNRRKK